MKNFTTFMQRHRWKLAIAGLLVILLAGFIRYYSLTFVQEKSKAIAAKALKDTVNEAWIKITKVEMAADALVPLIEQNLDNPDTMFVLSRKVLSDNDAIKGCSVSFEPYFFKDKGRYFSAYSYNGDQDRLTEQEGDDDYQYFYMDWYLIPRQLNKKYWIEPYEETINEDSGTKEIMTTYSQPLHNAQDSLVGVLSVDVPLKWLSDIILAERPLPGSYCMLIGRGGTYIVHPDQNRLLYETILTPTLEGKNPELFKLGRAMISGETGTQKLVLDGVESHVFYMPFARTGWSLALVCPDKDLMLNYYLLSGFLIALMVLAFIAMLTPLWCRVRHTSVLMMLMLTGAYMLTSCEEQQKTSQQKTEADSLINEAYKMHDYERLLSLAELHESSGALSDMKLCYWRGYAYSRLRKMRQAEMEWKKAITLNIDNDEDLEYYSKSANRLAGLLYMKCNYESTIRIATTSMNVLKEKEYDWNTDYANLLIFMGCCQVKLERLKEAEANFNEAWPRYLEATTADNDITNYSSSIVGIVALTDAYILSDHYQEAYGWTERFDSLLTRYRQQPQAEESFIDKQWARLNLYKATALEGLNQKAEAEKAYQTALNTKYAKTRDGQIESTTYLIKAERWSEAADMFKSLDSQLQRYDVKQTMDNIQMYMNPKFVANARAHRTDSAIAAGISLCTALDSAIIWERQNSAIELATIYDIQVKETELVEQKAHLSQQRYLMTVIILVLIIISSGLFIYFRHQSAMRLEAAYHELEKANIRAEESSRMKSAFIQQISHEIRTPLNILSGFSQVITTPDIELDDEQRASINQQIMENTDRITGLVNKMLELSDAKSQSELEKNDHTTVEQLAAEAVDISGITNARHLTFDMNISPDIQELTLTTNLQAAVRALSLLLDNARKFTAPAEALSRDTQPTEMQHVMLRVNKQDDHLVFAVEDSGIGIPAEEAERIFDEFVQLDEYYNGTGIGLTVARSMARRLGGDIVLDTAYTKGARFVFTLPINS